MCHHLSRIYVGLSDGLISVIDLKVGATRQASRYFIQHMIPFFKVQPFHTLGQLSVTVFMNRYCDQIVLRTAETCRVCHNICRIFTNPCDKPL